MLLISLYTDLFKKLQGHDVLTINAHLLNKSKLNFKKFYQLWQAVLLSKSIVKLIFTLDYLHEISECYVGGLWRVERNKLRIS